MVHSLGRDKLQQKKWLKNDRKIIKHLKSIGRRACSIREINKETKINRQTITTHLEKLEKESIVERVKWEKKIVIQNKKIGWRLKLAEEKELGKFLVKSVLKENPDELTFGHSFDNVTCIVFCPPIANVHQYDIEMRKTILRYFKKGSFEFCEKKKITPAELFKGKNKVLIAFIINTSKLMENPKQEF